MTKHVFFLAWFLLPRIILPFSHTVRYANTPFILFLSNASLYIYTKVYYLQLLTNIYIISSLELPSKETPQMLPHESFYGHVLLRREGGGRG